LYKVEEERSHMATISDRQRMWIGDITRGDFLLTTIIEGKRKSEGLREMLLLDWMMLDG